jgi:two-component sensor histidine kinase
MPMPTTQVQPSAELASAGYCENAFGAESAYLVEHDSQSLNGLIALGERPARAMTRTTVRALLSRISSSTQVPFDNQLRDLCDGLVATFGRSGGPNLTRASADLAVPFRSAITLGLIADLLITNAFLYAFPPGRGGRIAVSFTALREAWQLTVEDSGIAVQGDGDRRHDGLTIARHLVLRLGGLLEFPRVTGGTRCIVTLPQPELEGIDFRHFPAL